MACKHHWLRQPLHQSRRARPTESASRGRIVPSTDRSVGRSVVRRSISRPSVGRSVASMTGRGELAGWLALRAPQSCTCGCSRAGATGRIMVDQTARRTHAGAYGHAGLDRDERAARDQV